MYHSEKQLHMKAISFSWSTSSSIFKPNGSRIFFAQSLFYAVFDLLPTFQAPSHSLCSYSNMTLFSDIWSSTKRHLFECCSAQNTCNTCLQSAHESPSADESYCYVAQKIQCTYMNPICFYTSIQTLYDNELSSAKYKAFKSFS